MTRIAIKQGAWTGLSAGSLISTVVDSEAATLDGPLPHPVHVRAGEIRLKLAFTAGSLSLSFPLAKEATSTALSSKAAPTPTLSWKAASSP